MKALAKLNQQEAPAKCESHARQATIPKPEAHKKEETE